MNDKEFSLDVSIIIVNYNTKQLLADCLNSIYEQTKGIDFEVIVSDNGSVDGSIEMLKTDFPQAILIENNANLGFGAANNRGLAIAKGKYIFYLNSDTILLNNAVKIFFDYWEENGDKENIGALGANLIDAKEKATRSGGDFPIYKNELSISCHSIYGFSKLLFLSFFLNKKLPTPEKKQTILSHGNVDYIIGADMFLKNDERAVFDQDFFMYYEEIFLQYKLYLQNKNRMIIDGPKIIHLEGASSKKITADIIHKEASFSAIQNKISRIIYFKKTGISSFKIFILKVATILLWLNPLLFKTNLKYIKDIIMA